MEQSTTGGGALIAFLTKTRTGKEIDKGGAALVSKGVEAVSGFFGRRRAKREQNAARVLELAERKVAQGSGEHTEPDESDVEQLVEAASRADDANVQELFANLLASKFDPKKASSSHRAFALILEQMSEVDARLVRAVYGAWKGADEGARKNGQIAFESLAGAQGFSREVAQLSAENLIRLGVFDRGGAGLGNMNRVAAVNLTPFGALFAAVVLGEAESYPFPYSRAQ